MTAEQIFATALVSAVKINRTTIVDALSKGEATASTLVHGFVDHLKVNGIGGVVYGFLKTAIDAQIDQIVNQFGPDELYELLLSGVTSWAKTQGVQV